LSEKQKLFYALYLQEKPKIVIALCPATSTYLFDEDYQVEMASIILRDIGYNVSRDLRDAKRQLRRGLPEVNYAGGHSFEEIKIFLIAVNEDWDFKRFKAIEIDQGRVPKYNSGPYEAIRGALLRREEKSEAKNRWFGW
jgi:hypothetical protein